jgi:indole-3-glycerol phosphate synthase
VPAREENDVTGAGAGADVLARIASDRRRRIAEMQQRVAGHVLRARLTSIAPAGRLERALRRGGAGRPLRLLCEIKRASPSRGVLNNAVDPVAMAKVYEQGGAAAISIVTEPDHFRGDLEWMNRVRAAVALPLLLKDFVLDSYQLLDAAVRGADGVLLLASLLSDVQLQRLIGEARLLGLDALVEVHDADELKRSIRAGATLVGINNRDLRTFEVNLGTSIELLPEVPPLVTAVAESGLSRPEHLERLRETRCDAALMGEVFMTSPDPAATLRELAAAARGGA